MKRHVLIAAAAALPACVPGAGTKVATIGSFAEAKAELGRTVRVSGVVQREKMGDTIDAPGLNVMCQSERFADEVVGTTVTVEGKLTLVEGPVATVGPNGEISQGYEAGTAYYVLEGCARR